MTLANALVRWQKNEKGAAGKPAAPFLRAEGAA